MQYGHYENFKDVGLDTWRFGLQISEALLIIGIFFNVIEFMNADKKTR